MFTDGSFPWFVRNGPEAMILAGLSSPGLPFSWIDASSFRSALLIDELNALSSTCWTFSLSSPPPQEASVRVAKRRQASDRRTRRRLAGPPQLDALPDVGNQMGYVKRIAGIAAVAAVATAAPAQAGQVIVVDGNHAQRVQDPAVPTRAE